MNRNQVAAAAAIGVSLLAANAYAQPVGNEMLAAVIETGNVYVITNGGNFGNATPFATVSPDFAYGLCRRPNGTVLLAALDSNNNTGTVYDITSGTPVVFATGLGLAVALHCDANEVLVTDANVGVFDITAGGNFSNATPFATGISSVGLLRDSQGTLWATHYDVGGIPGPYGIFNITAGGNFTGVTPLSVTQGGQAVSLVQVNNVYLTNELDTGRVVNFTGGGDLAQKPTFATLPNVLSLANSATTIWAGTVNGMVFDITAGGNFSNAAPFASGLGGNVYGILAPDCGDGILQAPEQCDDAGESATCNSNCTLSSCGDGVANASAGEMCDGGGETANCNANCTIASCGDGLINATAGEICDDMGESAACDSDCSPAACGDGTLNVTAAEQCDDGNNLNGDGCDSQCQGESSGNGGGSGVGGAAVSSTTTGSGGASSSGNGGASTTGNGGASSSDDDGVVVVEGCGCSVPGTSPSRLGWLALLALLFPLRRRRTI